MALQIHNSLSDQKEAFTPLHKNRVTLYVCGPTVYGDAHLGHAKTYVSFDVILRYFQLCGYQTFYVQNITDVGHLVGDADEGEDKILRKAREANREPMAIVETYTCSYFRVMDQLQVQRPDISPRATGHIPEQIEAIEDLIANGYAYEVDGSVYFEVAKDPEYGQLSNRNLEELLSGTRVEERSDKRNAQDFALWKKADAGHLMRWKDPWSGAGYPGWHTECTVMSTKYLGDTFDIHGGGMELKFPHHECEIAQARGLKKGFARYWMHSNMLTIEGQKMGKSLGNFVTLDDAFQKYDPMVVRYFMVASHYRSVVDYSEKALNAAQQALQRLHQTTARLRQQCPPELKPSHQHFQEYRQRFCEAMDDDFSTPKALAALFDLSRELNPKLANHSLSPEEIVDAESLYSTLGGEVLGIIPEDLEQGASDQAMDEVMQLVIDLRNRAREQKDYATSDEIRDRLDAAKIQLKDSKEGTSWDWSDS